METLYDLIRNKLYERIKQNDNYISREGAYKIAELKLRALVVKLADEAEVEWLK